MGEICNVSKCSFSLRPLPPIQKQCYPGPTLTGGAWQIKSFFFNVNTMLQKCFNALAILSSHKEMTDQMSIIDVANEFVGGKPNRKSIFGKLVEEDL